MTLPRNDRFYTTECPHCGKYVSYEEDIYDLRKALVAFYEWFIVPTTPVSPPPDILEIAKEHARHW